MRTALTALRRALPHGQTLPDEIWGRRHRGIVALLWLHAAGFARPWRWALIHGVFVVSAGAANVVAWRLNEDVRVARTRDSERRAEESEERFRSIFERAPLGIVLSDLEGRILEGNSKRAAMLGLPEGDLRDLSLGEFTHPDDRDAVRGLLAQLAGGEREWSRLEKRDVRADGSVVWTNLTVSVVRDSDIHSRLPRASPRGRGGRRE